MDTRFLLVFVGMASLVAPLAGQQRRATLTGIGTGDQGKCTVEVVVDGAAEVEIRGDSAFLRTLSGQPAQWRRFECTGRMPANPTDFRFKGVDGRGRQQLVRDPRNGGVAVVRIEDPNGGAEAYTFDIEWTGGTGPYGGRTGDYRDRDYRDRNYRGPISGQPPLNRDTIRACEDAVRQQAFSRFNTRDVAVRVMDQQDNVGRRDELSGNVSVRDFNGRDQNYQFTCLVNSNTGRVLSARIDGAGNDRYAPNADRGPFTNTQTIQNCERAVEDRIRRDGYGNGRVEFGSINVDDRPGRGDWIVGSARSGRDSFNFACSVNLNNGNVRSVEVNRQ